MNLSDLLNNINKTYSEAFGNTPTDIRLNDILKEAFELTRARTMTGLKDETSDLLGTLIQWINEAGYDFNELVEMNITKINSRSLYRKLGRKVSVALIGGAFDPIHPGHLAIGKFLLDEAGLFDEVWYIPCYRHLYGKEMAPASLRLAMCREYVQVDKRMKVCDYEIVHELAGETYYFLNKFMEEDFAKNEYRFNYVIGLDNANTFDKWVNYEHLEKLIPFIVVSRQGEKRDPNVNWYMKEPHKFFDAGNKIPKISSTDIRKELKEDREKYLRESPFLTLIAGIIQENNLYV